jgi:hypothetical protein
MDAPSKSRWVEPRLLSEKRSADEAGAAYRAARGRFFTSNFRYFWHLQARRIEPLKSLAISPERAAQAKARANEKVAHWDAERKDAQLALAESKQRLAELVAHYRAAKLRKGEHES